VSCIFGGSVAGPNAVRYARNLQAASSNGHFEAERKHQEENNATLMKSEGTENPFRLWRELGELMTKDCTVIRYNKNLIQTDAKLVELLERFLNINLSDRSQWANTSVVFTRQLYNMLQLSRVIAQGAALRDESRGAHYKPEFPERDDKNFLKTTKAYFAPDADEPKFEFEPVDVSLIPPRPRKY
jgi:succinate dehydrogenase / fumarate reductase flavoprotein subunit